MKEKDNNFCERHALLDYLKKEQFGEGAEIQAAIFLTYSIESKTILAALISLFTEEKSAKGEILDIKERWNSLLEPERDSDLCKRVAFVCNDGNDKSEPAPIYWYTKELVSYFKFDYSFHPKLYIVKYTIKGYTYFRFMIGSMNFVNSKNEEYMVCFDIQAYTEKSNNTEYIQCSFLNSLLNCEKNGDRYLFPNIVQPTNLSHVLENMQLDKFYFKKDEMPEILVDFDNDDVSKELKCSDIIISPFLSKSFIDGNSKSAIYTMKNELKKHGYVEIPENTSEDNAIPFFVYKEDSDDEESKVSTHIKMYIKQEQKQNKWDIYAGSLNFTESAFKNNKEILCKLELPGEENPFKEYLENNYEKKYYVIENNSEEKEEEEKNKIRKIAKKISSMLVLKICESKFKLSLKDEDDREQVKNEYNEFLNRENSKMKICPFLMENNKGNERELFDAQGQIKELDLEWEINRFRFDNSFYFIWYSNDAQVYKYKYQIDMKSNESDNNSYDSSTLRKMNLSKLSMLLSNNRTKMSMLTKSNTWANQNLEAGILLKGFRNKIPSLEKMLEKAVNKNEKLSDVIGQNKWVYEIQEFIIRKGTEDEKKELGIGVSGMNDLVIKSLLNQYQCLINDVENNAEDNKERES